MDDQQQLARLHQRVRRFAERELGATSHADALSAVPGLVNDAGDPANGMFYPAFRRIYLHQRHADALLLLGRRARLTAGSPNARAVALALRVLLHEIVHSLGPPGRRRARWLQTIGGDDGVAAFAEGIDELVTQRLYSGLVQELLPGDAAAVLSGRPAPSYPGQLAAALRVAGALAEREGVTLDMELARLTRDGGRRVALERAVRRLLLHEGHSVVDAGVTAAVVHRRMLRELAPLQRDWRSGATAARRVEWAQTRATRALAQLPGVVRGPGTPAAGRQATL